VVVTQPVIVGQTVNLKNYSFTLDNIIQNTEANYHMTQAGFTVKKDLSEVAQLTSEKRFYPGRQTSTTEAGIESGFIRDLYVTLGEPLAEQESSTQAWSVQFQVRPFIRWIWLGTLLMACGGLIAILDRRYRQPQEAVNTAVEDANV
jgi:cytochrome c-type biogenesis protein CcmF